MAEQKIPPEELSQDRKFNGQVSSFKSSLTIKFELQVKRRIMPNKTFKLHCPHCGSNISVSCPSRRGIAGYAEAWYETDVWPEPEGFCCPVCWIKVRENEQERQIK